MLRVRDLKKYYLVESGRRLLFEDLNFDLGPAGRLAILGRNGQGKSTLLKILGGVVAPTSGEVTWTMTNSWPLGFGGAFQGGLSGIDNIRFIARIYNKPVEHTVELVEEFAQLGKQLADPVKFYSSGMRARLSFGISLAIDFDCYLIDEVISVGDALFRAKCQTELFEVRKKCAFIMASHDMVLLQEQCDQAIIIEKGRAKLFDDIDLAIDIYTSICEGGRYLEPLASQ